MLVTLCGGVGAARMLSGLVRVVPPASITAIVNVGDDTVLHGLHISPDLDTITYTLAGMDNRETGWGIVGETWTVMDELARLGGESWFRSGDRDLATHLYRTERLHAGDSLTEVTAALATRRQIGIRLLPVTDDPVRTMLTLTDDHRARTRRHRGGIPGLLRPAAPRRGRGCRPIRRGRDGPSDHAGARGAPSRRSSIVVCPSNPIVSIGPLLAVPGILATLTARRDDVIAVSPISRRRRVEGPGRHGCMRELGTEPSVVGVARLYAPWVSTLVIDEADRDHAAAVEAEGVRCVVAPTIMDSPERAAALARVVIDAGG